MFGFEIAFDIALSRWVVMPLRRRPNCLGDANEVLQMGYG